MSVMRKFFSASLHPDVLADRRSPEEVWFGMFGYLAAREHAAIDYAVSRMATLQLVNFQPSLHWDSGVLNLPFVLINHF